MCFEHTNECQIAPKMKFKCLGYTFWCVTDDKTSVAVTNLLFFHFLRFPTTAMVCCFVRFFPNMIP